MPADGLRRGTLADLGRMFLYEIMRANAGFAEARAKVARELSDPIHRARVVRQLDVGGRNGEAIAQALEEESQRAISFGITEATVTFWVEPARPGWFERLYRWLLRKPIKAFDDYYSLAPAGRSAGAIQCIIKVARDDAHLGATIHPRDGMPPIGRSVPGLGSAGLLARGALIFGPGETS